MAKRTISETRRKPVMPWEGYQGGPVPPGAKPVKSPAADVPSKGKKDASPKPPK
jgi:hypothetical protein